MKTKFSLMIAAAVLALTAFSYGQAGTDVKKAADDTGKATETAARDGTRHQESRREDRRRH